MIQIPRRSIVEHEGRRYEVVGYVTDRDVVTQGAERITVLGTEIWVRDCNFRLGDVAPGTRVIAQVPVMQVIHSSGWDGHVPVGAKEWLVSPEVSSAIHNDGGPPPQPKVRHAVRWEGAPKPKVRRTVGRSKHWMSDRHSDMRERARKVAEAAKEKVAAAKLSGHAAAHVTLPKHDDSHGAHSM